MAAPILTIRRLFCLCAAAGLFGVIFFTQRFSYDDALYYWDDKDLLKSYSRRFNNGILDPKVKANVTSSITAWWQAAAMIESYIRGPVRYACKDVVAMGNWHVCQDEPYKVKPPCLVYSFGIAFDFSFDDAMGRLGCEVHSFDPSMEVEDHIRNENVTFHAYGISHKDLESFSPNKDEYVKNDRKWKVLTLKSFMEKLGHEKRNIDVLKIDVEAYEWLIVNNIMENQLFSRIRQFLVEWHLFPDRPIRKDFVHAFNIYTQLREAGFLEFHVNPHPMTHTFEKFNIQGDSEYVNSLFVN